MKQTVCIYGGSSSRVNERYLNEARQLGVLAAQAGYGVICGGGRGGIMAAAIEGAVSVGGEAIGVLPDFMIERNWQHPQLTELVVTDTMHERKARMMRDAALCVACPGGIGTFEELLEIITWRQLGLYKGIVAIMNVNGFYTHLFELLDHANHEGFMRKSEGRLYYVVADAREAMELLEKSKNS